MKSGFRRSSTLLVGVAVAAVAVAVVASGATARTAQTGSVCVLLPDTKSSVRWEQFDKPAFVAAFKKAGVKATVVNALNDPQKQLSQAEQCISSGAKVGIITSTRHRYVDRDPEEVHGRRWQDDRLRPPDRRRHRLRLRRRSTGTTSGGSRLSASSRG